MDSEPLSEDTFEDALQSINLLVGIVDEIRDSVVGVMNRNEELNDRENKLRFLKLRRIHEDVRSIVPKIDKEADQHKKVLEENRIRLENILLGVPLIRVKIAQLNNYVPKSHNVMEQFIDNYEDHETVVSSLEKELTRRRELDEQIKSYEKTYATLKRENDQQAKEFTRFEKHSRQLFQNGDKISQNDALSSYLPKRIDTHPRSHLLASPLHTFYNILLDYRENFAQDEHVRVSVNLVGDFELVGQYWRRKPRKRQKMIEEEFKELNVFPVGVSATFDYSSNSSSSRKISFVMRYLYDAGIVVVKSENPTDADLLERLYLDDRGRGSPIHAVLTDFDFSELEEGRPFKWAQRLCGLTPLESSSEDDEMRDLKSRVISFRAFLKILQFRVNARNVLQSQLRILSKLKVPNYSSFLDQSIEMVKFHKKDDNRMEIDDKIQGKKDNQLFEGVLQNSKHKDKFHIRFSLEIDYYHPVIIPMFRLSFTNGKPEENKKIHKNVLAEAAIDPQRMSVDERTDESSSSQLKDIENQINEQIPKTTRDMERILQTQFEVLVQSLTIFYDCVFVGTRRATVGSGGNVEHKYCNRTNNGLDRTMPIRMNVKKNVFE